MAKRQLTCSGMCTAQPMVGCSHCVCVSRLSLAMFVQTNLLLLTADGEPLQAQEIGLVTPFIALLFVCQAKQELQLWSVFGNRAGQALFPEFFFVFPCVEVAHFLFRKVVSWKLFIRIQTSYYETTRNNRLHVHYLNCSKPS